LGVVGTDILGNPLGCLCCCGGVDLVPWHSENTLSSRTAQPEMRTVGDGFAANPSEAGFRGFNEVMMNLHGVC
jgi:hypothetical protein